MRRKVQLQAEVLDLTRRLAEETSSRKKSAYISSIDERYLNFVFVVLVVRAYSRLEESKDALISAEKESLVVKTQIQDILESRREVAAE